MPPAIEPTTSANWRSRAYVSGSYDVGYEASAAGSPLTESATAATLVTNRTRTSRLAGKGLVELRLDRLSRPGRMLASASACSGVSAVTDATRLSAVSLALSAATASGVASGAR